ncbi:hypothetical protein IPG36_07925 [bacterium]|nr:MAG: hypothetical protein IPG36_07925 [bacterium]
MVSSRTVVIVAVSAVVAAALAGGSVYWVMQQKATASQDEQSTTIASLRRQLSDARATPTPAKSTSPTPTVTPITDVAIITNQAKAFTAKLGTASEDAVDSLFTTAFQKTYKDQHQSSVGKLLGIQDTPDQGYTYGTPSVKGTAADVTVSFKYSGTGTTNFKFSFQKSGTTWLISSITKQ